MGKLRRERNRLIGLVNQLEVCLYEPLYDTELFQSGHWDYVCYDFGKFLNHLDEAHYLLGRQEGLKFIDVGCGLGTKVHLAGEYFDSYGLELNEQYARVARRVNHKKEFHTYGRYKRLDDKKRIFQTDALTFDYSDFDVIYYFRPMRNNKMQRTLEKRVFEQMKPGSIVIPIYAISSFPSYIHHLPTSSGELYFKAHNEKRAQAMIALAKKL